MISAPKVFRAFLPRDRQRQVKVPFAPGRSRGAGAHAAAGGADAGAGLGGSEDGVAATQSPLTYSAAPLPAGLVINPVTGAITGIPSAVGTTNATGTGNAALTLTVTAVPAITNTPLTADGTLRLPFSFAITASGSPTGYSTSALPPGLTLHPVTCVISGVPTTKGATLVTLRATNSTGTGTATLNVKVSDGIRVTIRGPLGTIIYLTEGAALPPAGTTYSIKGLPAGFVLDPATGRVTTPSVVAAKPGTYTVTCVATTTVADGKKTKGPATTFTITVDPLIPPMSGAFETILDASPITGLPIGKVELLVNAHPGGFTGKLTHVTSPKVYPLKGLLTLGASYRTATGSATIKRGSLETFRLNLAFDTAAVAGQVFAASLDQVTGAGALVATLGRSETGTQLASFSQASPAPWRGNYTLTLDDPAFPPLNLGTEVAPEGTGFGLVTIDATRGLMVFKGKLGDGAPLTASLAPGPDGSYCWYVKHYKSSGYLGGRIRYTPVAGDPARYQVTGPVGSELYWAKSAASRDRDHRAGFGPIALTATSQRWIIPTSSTALRSPLKLNGNVVFTSFTSAGLPTA